MPKASEKKKSSREIPMMSPEAVENRIISKAYKAIEKRIDDGTATAAELVHFAREGSLKQQYELEKLKKENELLRAKTEMIASQKEVKELYAEAITAFRKYSGMPSFEETDEDD